jgi:hypothetical protein
LLLNPPDESLKTPWCFTEKSVVFSITGPDEFRKQSGTIKSCYRPNKIKDEEIKDER